MLVRFQPGLTSTDLATIQQKATALGAGAAHPLAQFAPNDWIVDVSGAASLDVAAHALAAADARVVGVGPDLMLSASETPNDPDFSQQSDMTMIGAPTAWNRTHGSPYRRIAILDTGIDEAHPDLNGAVVARQDFTSSPAGADDVVGHGTHVGGIAGAVANNGQGIAGMSFSSNLLNVKVLGDDGQGTISAVVHGIYWAADNGASVINMSFATTDGADCNPSFWENLFETGRASLRDAINYAWAKNVFLVAAAGNTGTSIPLWPATCPHVMSVANLAQDSSINSKSTFGSFVSVAAPGTAVLSTRRARFS